MVLLVMPALVLTALSGCIMAEPFDPEGKGRDHPDQSPEPLTPTRADDRHEHRAAAGTASQECRIAPEDAYLDASPRYANTVDGRESASRTISVPVSTETLRVALVHDSDARFSFTVKDPLHLTKASETGRGEKYMLEDDWLVVHDPLPGDWQFDLTLRGTSSYTVGFYLD